jgi:peptide/nickel transport system ATP-binding protein
MGAIPSLAPSGDRLQQIPGSMPRLSEVPKACAFAPRCPSVFARCRVERPVPVPAGESLAACFLNEPDPFGLGRAPVVIDAAARAEP